MVHRRKQLIVVGTPLHALDLYSVLRDSGEYEFRTYPAEDDDGVPLWPERYSRSDLDAKKREIGSARYAREFLAVPLTDEASLFPSTLFAGPEVRLPYVLGLGASYWDGRNCPRYTGVDIAMSAETGGDYFVIFTVAVDDSGNRWIANIRRGKGWSFTKQLDAIKEEYYLMRSEIIFIEANQMQRVWTDEIARTSDLPVRKFFTSGMGGRQPLNAWKKAATNIVVNKNHLDRGVPSLRIPLEHRKWRIPRGNEYSIEMTDLWIGEMGSVGWHDGKVVSVGKHDDLLMAGWMSEMAVRLYGAHTSWLEDAGAASSALGDNAVVSASALDAERDALAALEEGRRVEVDRDSYFSRVRSAMRKFTEDAYDAEDFAASARGTSELQRLDATHGFSAYSETVDTPNPNGYDALLGGSPKFEDMDLF